MFRVRLFPIVAVTALAGAAADAAAEVIRFPNGAVLQGDVIAADGHRLTVRRYDNAGVVTLAWSQILEADRHRLQPRAEAAPVEPEVRAPRELTEEERFERLVAQVKPRFFSALRLVVNKRARAKHDVVGGVQEEFSLRDAKAWATKEAGKEAAEMVAGALDISVEDVRAAFAQRKSFDYRRATYGDGTFTVEASPLPRGRWNLKSPDAWWKQARASTRAQWLTAYYAEQAGEMQILRIDTRPCSGCGGRGALPFINPGSERAGTQWRPCHRCHGVRHDRTVVYR